MQQCDHTFHRLLALGTSNRAVSMQVASLGCLAFVVLTGPILANSILQQFY
jgi:hypothetical protein